MKKLIIAFLLSTYSCIAYSSSDIFSTKFKELDFHQVQEIVHAYINFMKETEKKIPLSNRTTSYPWNNFSAYADENEICFFGGQKSVQLNGRCKFPERQSGYRPCTNANQFRCSPILFGDRCIDTGGTFLKITEKCHQQSQGDIATIVENIKQDSEEISRVENQIDRFCRLNPGYNACRALKERVREITQYMANEESISSSMLQDNMIKNRALGILNVCQDYHQEKNNTFFANLFASDRDIIAGIKDYYAQCDQKTDNIADYRIEDLTGSMDDIEGFVNGQEILNFTNRANLRGVLQALFVTEIGYQGKINEEEALNLVCDRRVRGRRSRGARRCISSNAELHSLIRREIDSFKLVQSTTPEENMSRTVQSLKHFAGQLNNVCESARHEYTENLESMCSRRPRGGRCARHSEHARKVWAETQNEMQQMVSNFDPSMKRFFVTNHFRQEIFSFNEDIAQKCALGRISEVFNSNISSEDIEQSVQQFRELMHDELASIHERQRAIEQQDSGKIYQEIKNVLKYRPYLMGSYLENFHNDSQDLENVAKYICKASLEIYAADKFWNIAEVGIGAATLATAAAATLIPGVGPFLSTGVMAKLTTAASFGVAGAEVSLAGSRIIDSSSTLQGVTVGRAQWGLSDERQQSEIERAQSQRNWAVFDSIASIVGLTGSIKGARAVARVQSTSEEKGFLNQLRSAQNFNSDPSMNSLLQLIAGNDSYKRGMRALVEQSSPEKIEEFLNFVAALPPHKQVALFGELQLVSLSPQAFSGGIETLAQSRQVRSALSQQELISLERIASDIKVSPAKKMQIMTDAKYAPVFQQLPSKEEQDVVIEAIIGMELEGKKSDEIVERIRGVIGECSI